MAVFKFERRPDVPHWLERSDSCTNQPCVRLHSEDGLSVLVSLSLLVASSKLMRDVLKDTIMMTSDIHVTVADMDGDTLVKFAEVLKKGKLASTAEQQHLKANIDMIIAMFQSNVQLSDQTRKARSISSSGHFSKQRSMSVSRMNARRDARASGYMSDRGESNPRDPRRRIRNISPPKDTSTPKPSPIRPPLRQSSSQRKLHQSIFDRLRDVEQERNSPPPLVKAEPINYDINENFDASLDNAPARSRIGEDVVLIDCLLHCPFCGKQFRRQAALQKHVQSQHPEPAAASSSSKRSSKSPAQPRATKCELCNKLFSKGGYKNHMNKVHPVVGPGSGKTFPCPICANVFSTKANMRRHVKIHYSNNDESPMDLTAKVIKRKRSDNGQFVRSEGNPTDQTQTRFQCLDCLEYFDEESLETHQESSGHKGHTRFKMPENMRM